MMIGKVWRWLLCAVLMWTALERAAAQQMERRQIRALVTYCSSTAFYIDAGRVRGLAAGDTVTAIGKSASPVRGIILAVSSSSSSVVMAPQSAHPAVGDSAFVVKDVLVEDNPPPAISPAGSPPAARTTPVEKNVSGRIALQYGASGRLGASMDFNQPAVLMRIEAARLFGTGITFAMYGRTYYDLAKRFSYFSLGPRFAVRAYELSLSDDDGHSLFGWSAGRMVSRYVGGIGAVDGAQAVVHTGDWTLGGVAGAQPNYSNSGVDPAQSKFALFARYRWGGEVFKTSDVTFAYGQQLYKGHLDRDFLYVQTFLRLGSDLFFSSSSDVDLHVLHNGVPSRRLSLTNTFATVSYAPLAWLSVNAGYDASRLVYLFESMRSIADTLLDKTLKEGWRGSVYFHLPQGMTLGFQGNFRLPSGGQAGTHTDGTSFRVSDLLGSEVNAGVQYSSIKGIYTEGYDWTWDIDRWIGRVMSLSFHLDKFHYLMRGDDTRMRTTTAGAVLNWRVTGPWYLLLSADQVWDVARSTQRIFLDCGIHF